MHNLDNEESIELPEKLGEFGHQSEEAQKRVVEKLHHNVIQNIQRHECFNDYVHARRKKWFKSEGILKITSRLDRAGPRQGSSLQVSVF